MKTADLIDHHASELTLVHLPFRQFGIKRFIDAGFAMRLWEEGLKTRHLCVGQPKQIRQVHRSFFEP